MCMVLAEKGINREKALKMAIIHDIAEAETGDIITKESWEKGGTMSRKEKIKLEEAALDKLMGFLGKDTAEEIRKLWKEYTEGKTKEAVFVRDIDVAEMIIQAYSYHTRNKSRKPLHGFWDKKNMNLIKSKNIKKLLEEIIGSGR